jgi:hypothetical protein
MTYNVVWNGTAWTLRQKQMANLTDFKVSDAVSVRLQQKWQKSSTTLVNYCNPSTD